MTNPIYTATDKTVTFADRFGERKIANGELFQPGDELHLMDCNFTLEGYGIFRCAVSKNLAWVHRDTLEYVSGNLGLRDHSEEE